jgi:hypothetical protein
MPCIPPAAYAGLACLAYKSARKKGSLRIVYTGGVRLIEQVYEKCDMQATSPKLSTRWWKESNIHMASMSLMESSNN